MDTLTHTVLGACAGELIAGKKLGKQAMLLGAVFNNVPDIDVVSALWLSPSARLIAHRGITHSFFFVIIFSILMSFLLMKWKSNPDMKYMHWLLLVGSGMLIHIVIDAFTSYGTGWFEPFSHERISLNTLFIVDPLFTAPMLIGGIALTFFSMYNRSRKLWALWSLSLSSCYLIFTFANKLQVDAVVKSELKNRDELAHEFLTTPTPYNTFLWMAIANDSANCYIAYYSIFDDKKNLIFQKFEKNDALVSDFTNRTDLNELRQFSQGYYQINQHDSSLWFSDLRFGRVGGWDGSLSPFVFQYDLKKEAENKSVFMRGRMDAAGTDMMKSLYKRIINN